MPPRDPHLRLQDMLKAIRQILDLTRDFDLDRFSLDDRTNSAVLAKFLILREAAARVPAGLRLGHPEVPWQKMIGLRNVIVHAYFTVKPEIVWGTVRDDLPALPPLLQRILDE